MKIHQLQNGARFEYEGEEYVKTGPLFGTGKLGQRLIPKYALLKPLDGAVSAGQTKSAEAVAEARILTAFAAFYQECQAWVPPAHQAEMQKAREKFLTALGHR